MVRANSSISVAVEPPEAWIRIAGRAAVESSRDFKAAVQKLTAEGTTHFILDLSECFLMDSTFSGVLAGLIGPADSTAAGQPVRRFTLVQPNERVADLLDNLGVLPLVDRVDRTPDPNARPKTAAVEVRPGEQTHQEVAECCLEAHRVLMALNPANAAKFRAVEQILVAQLQNQLGPDPESRGPAA